MGSGRDKDSEGGNMGRTDQTKGHLRCCMENKYGRSFLECIKNKVIKIQWPNNKGNEASTGHLLSPNKSYSSRNVLHLIKFMPKGITWTPQTTQVFAKAVDGLLSRNGWLGPVTEDSTSSTHWNRDNEITSN